MSTVEEIECFLCQPDEELVVRQHSQVFSMVGLGPLTDRYLMIAANAHMRSFADMYLADQSIIGEIEAVRDILEAGASPLLMTEHGRVPACVNDGDEHDAHCFHAHFLLFQAASDIEEMAAEYFMRCEIFDRLGQALEYASTSENYHFLSPHSKRYLVFTGALNVPRQFFRNLVAIAEAQPERADWRCQPNRDQAVENAAKERKTHGAARWD